MKSGPGISSSELVLDFLTMIWTPGMEAWKLQRDWNVGSLEDILAAAERAGYEICYADLPTRVSGFALVMAGQPYIVVNRAKSSQHQQYTVVHELGHHVLHLNPSRDSQQLALFSSKDMAEAEANLFAATWLMIVAKDKVREEMVRENPEALLFPAVSVLMTGAVILIAVLAYLWLRLSSRD